MQRRDRLAEAVVVGGIDTIPGAARDFYYSHHLVLSLNPNQSDFSRDVAGAGLFERRLIQQQIHLELPGEAFETRCQIDRVADRRIVKMALATQVANDRIPSRDPDADTEILKPFVPRCQ